MGCGASDAGPPVTWALELQKEDDRQWTAHGVHAATCVQTVAFNVFLICAFNMFQPGVKTNGSPLTKLLFMCLWRS